MNPADAGGLAREFMRDFAITTGLDPPAFRPRRYLWTDAFAVCNYLGFFRNSGDPSFRELAVRLIDQVHHTLGRYGEGDPRTGWISGLSAVEGELHPAIGGLRIGKNLPERGSAEPYNEQMEWERDGQYFHYLTQWMRALSLAGRVTGNTEYLRSAVELARTADAKFTCRTGGRMRMHWKMSIDLSRPLVPSMGQHDPLDGLVAYAGLQAEAGEAAGRKVLGGEIEDMAGMVRDMPLATSDPLGIGGLLCNAERIANLTVRGISFPPDLFPSVIASARKGLDIFSRTGGLNLPADYRLAFRELGLAIGLSATERLPALIAENPQYFRKTATILRQVKALRKYEPQREMIRAFWLEKDNRASGTWTGHREINTVMLATCLAPEGYLEV